MQYYYVYLYILQVQPMEVYIANTIGKYFIYSPKAWLSETSLRFGGMNCLPPSGVRVRFPPKSFLVGYTFRACLRTSVNGFKTVGSPVVSWSAGNVRNCCQITWHGHYTSGRVRRLDSGTRLVKLRCKWTAVQWNIFRFETSIVHKVPIYGRGEEDINPTLHCKMV